VSSALAKILDEDARVIVRVVGFLRPNDPIFRYGDRIEFCPLQDFLNLQRLIGEVELNIAPLQNNVFSNCKSELKYFEAAIVGTLTIASPTFTFRTAIRDGQNGFLCGAHEWDKKLRAAIDIIYDLKQYTSLVSSAYRHAQACYGWNCQAARIASAVFGDASETQARDRSETTDSASGALGDGSIPEKYRVARTSAK
jgi:glycosyltransferase involved in cell wall biosynthesis